MVPRSSTGGSLFESIRERYEDTEKKCPECGFVDEEGNWTSKTDGKRIVYHHACPSCKSSREHTFTLNK